MSNSLIFNSFQQNVDVLWEMLLVHFYKFSLVWCSVRDDIRLDLIASTSLDELQGPAGKVSCKVDFGSESHDVGVGSELDVGYPSPLN